ncbi:aggregation-promoting factor C-terminal-like domain-containing protein [Planctomonas psychrotolerans]|uniref:aggregation-promoting factor C-terminal-like domain-containing protein n=1 Tax=Planctomonas psychrotolerans TaxID=2528712 RepID=UPI001D0D3841|nr:hypothetical protein [Planctomonas psychrotolerans]
MARPVLAFAAAALFVAVSVVDPISNSVALPLDDASLGQLTQSHAQTLTLDGPSVATTAVAHATFSVIAPPPPPPPPPAPVAVPAAPVAKAAAASPAASAPAAPAPQAAAPAPAPAAPAAAVPNPGSAQAIAHDMVLARGWGEDQFNCLVSLWKKESGWRVNAMNPSSGAYGIPQSLPGSKMASAGADWATNPATQISWGLGYITSRYGTPCGAWSTSQAKGWY